MNARAANDKKTNAWRTRTALIHAAAEHNPSAAVSSPIYQSATYRFADPADIAEAMSTEAYAEFYGRYATPNTKQAETTLARLENGDAALVTASGMAAVSLVLLTELSAGDHLVAQNRLYPTTSSLITQALPRLGIESTLVDQTDLDAFSAAIQRNTRLIYLESPTNPTLTLTDLAAVAKLARSYGITTVVDNTFATPYNQRPLELGIDIVLHSATKYLAGHSDVIAGALISDAGRVSRLWQNHMMFGGVLHPMEAWLLERGLKTFTMRMRQHNENAQVVATYLNEHPAVRRVYYPGLPNHAQHTLARQQMPGGYGGMVCFDLRGGRSAGYQMLQNLRLITLAVSLGGVHSLITHPASTVSAVQSEEEIKASGVMPGLVRFSVGLEDSADILDDLDQALGALV
jgi:methionine-gamma-lyase